ARDGIWSTREVQIDLRRSINFFVSTSSRQLDRAMSRHQLEIHTKHDWTQTWVDSEGRSLKNSIAERVDFSGTAYGFEGPIRRAIFVRDFFEISENARLDMAKDLACA